MTKCTYEGCEEGYYCYGYHPAQYVTRDMAIDAGDRNLEGSLYSKEEYEWGACPCCEGDWENCARCSADIGDKLLDESKYEDSN